MKHRAFAWAAVLIAGALALSRADAADAAPPVASSPAATRSDAASPAVTSTSTASTRAPVSASGNEMLQVADPYLEMRTGPGRGYPVFFVVQRNDWIEIELRHTDWFRVRTETGKVGWVMRQQLESTLTAGGARKSFRDVMLDDFLSRRVQLGVAWGEFRSEPTLKLWTSVRMSETLSLEGTVGQVQGVFSGTDFWHVNIMTEPWSDRRFSPFAGVGVGRFTNFPNASLVNATTTSANLANAMVGVRYYLTDRVVLRADYSIYTVFVNDARTTEYRAWTGGLSFFF